MRFRAVLFDLDGTLLDTLEDLADSMNAVLERSGYPIHPLEAYRIFVGDGMENLVRRSVPDHVRRDAESTARALSAMRAEYATRWNRKSRPYKDVPQLLDALSQRGIPFAILSNKPHDFTRMVTRELLSQWHFSAVYGERSGVPRKPDPAGALEIARSLTLSPAEFVYAGDTNTDMFTAVGAGMYPVGVLWGFRGARELIQSGAGRLIDSPLQLLDLF